MLYRVYFWFSGARVDAKLESWERAWATIALKYPEMEDKRAWWCSDIVKGLIVQACKKSTADSHVPCRTNSEEGLIARAIFHAFH